MTILTLWFVRFQNVPLVLLSWFSHCLLQWYFTAAKLIESYCFVNWHLAQEQRSFVCGITSQFCIFFSPLACFPTLLGNQVGFSSTVVNILGIRQQYVHLHHSYHLGAQLWATWVLSRGAVVASRRPRALLIPNLTRSCLTDVSPWAWQASPLHSLAWGLFSSASS